MGFLGRSPIAVGPDDRRRTLWRDAGDRLPFLSRGVVAFGHSAPIDRRGCAELFLEQLDEVRRVGEIAHVAYARDGIVCRDEQEARVHQPLVDEPFVGRESEASTELLFESRRAAVA